MCPIRVQPRATDSPDHAIRMGDSTPMPLARGPGSLERTIAELSADEMVASLNLASAPAALRAIIRSALSAVSRPLGRVLARFDARIDAFGLARAATMALTDLGARWTSEGTSPPTRGPLLVVANHPGAYDALILLAALGRDDVAIVAADRTFLRALPALARHLLFVPEGPAAPPLERARGLRRALRQLDSGSALVHFGAGRIEPDPAFSVQGAPLLAPWSRGTGALVRGAASANGSVAVAIIEGVHSPRAKRFFLTRMAERRGVTTLALLLQVAVRRYRNVDATVRFAPVIGASELAQSGDDLIITERVRDRARALLPSRLPA
jgi:1-acyl-sn-glycerol-3-phosphate acyltransferase